LVETSYQTRLSKFVAQNCSLSRRKADILITSGAVKVNNYVLKEPYKQITENDVVYVYNKKVDSSVKKIYIKLYKPAKYLSDLAYDDPRKLAINLINISHYVYPVGRLDYSSEGLLLFTNDGEFAYRIMHPKFGIEKEYHVKLKGIPSIDDIESITRGVKKDNIFYRIERVRLLKKTENNSWYSFVVKEGKNRMIRIIGDAIGHPVMKLKRIRIGDIYLGKLEPGKYKFLTTKEISSIKIQ
jgi:23S rRNA pseudouridine2605 synthase